jgi:hypothetical protein
MEKSEIIDALKGRLDALENWRKGKANKEEKPDEEVCPICGGDLQWVEDNIVFCKKCNEYFEQTKVKE